MRKIIFMIVGVMACNASVDVTSHPPDPGDCRACTNPDLPECDGCLGPPGMPESQDNGLAPTVDQLTLSEGTLSFGIIGDTRPASVNDTAAYPTAVITQIFQDLQAENPRPGFAVGTGDYQFSSNGSTTTSPQLDLYLGARANFSNPEYPTMGNHECTGATAGNCGPGSSNGTTSVLTAYQSKILTPLGIHNPYYSLLVTPPNNAWSAKVVFVAANYWNSTQSSWLDTVLAQPTTYTFIVRHESSKANTAPGVTPSGAIIAKHPYTMLIVGHDHTYKHLSQKDVLVGNGGAPLTTGSAYGYGVVLQRTDGSIQFTFYNYKTHAVMDQFAVNADGSPATGNPPPPQATFMLGASPASVTSNGSSAASTIALTPLAGFAGSATLAAAGVPSGATATFGASKLGANQSTTLTLSPGSATSGTYSVSVAGTDGTETETANVTWTISGGTSSCAHDLCTSGGKLASSCDPCAQQICAQDSYCCTTSWSSICVAEVGSICGQSCSGGGGGSTCSHPICSTGGKLTSSCDTCATQVCAKDSYCCGTSWDATCVAEVGTICGETCP